MWFCGGVQKSAIALLFFVQQHESAAPTWPSLQGRTLDVVYIPYSQDAFESEPGKWRGVYPDLFDEVARSLGFRMREVELSNESQQLYPKSPFSACAHQVGSKQAHLCIGSFWVTYERRLMADYVTPSFRDNMKLFVEFVEDTVDADFSESVGRIFAPFGWKLWLVLGLTAAGIGIMSAVIDNMKRTGLQLQRSMFRRGQTVQEDLARMSSFVAESAHRGESLFSQDKTYARHQTVIRLASVILITVGTACYTASLSAHLSLKGFRRKHIEYTSLEALVDAGEAACVLEGAAAYVSARVPSARLVGKATYDEILDSFSRGECKGILSMINPERSPLANKCNMVAVGDPIVTIAVGQPASHEVEPILSAEITRLVALGRVHWLRQRYANRRECPNDRLRKEDNTDDDADQLGLREMYGLFMIIGVLICFSCVYQALSLYIRHRFRRVDEFLQACDETDVTSTSQSKETCLEGIAVEGHETNANKTVQTIGLPDPEWPFAASSVEGQEAEDHRIETDRENRVSVRHQL